MSETASLIFNVVEAGIILALLFVIARSNDRLYKSIPPDMIVTVAKEAGELALKIMAAGASLTSNTIDDRVVEVAGKLFDQKIKEGKG